MSELTESPIAMAFAALGVAGSLVWYGLAWYGIRTLRDVREAVTNQVTRNHRNGMSDSDSVALMCAMAGGAGGASAGPSLVSRARGRGSDCCWQALQGSLSEALSR